MQSWGIVSTLPSVFFTNWPIALNTAQNWARDEFDEDIGATKENWKFAVWGRLLPGDWLSEVAMELEDQMQAAGYSTDRKKKYQDLFLKNISQAFGELANGDIIVLVGDEAFPDNNWKADTAWGGKLHAPIRFDPLD
ncbi:hypothetical protein N7492_005243 [Penicillium capsulatum]|uniref:Uncharacterized protein n=1 Tax=Penicillium capsulatum TaxID=69766 RepID=A0A9W9I990_9EURO|nr:hypothetical protein N7492_005243 [Penicillium capsulatum]KAJ6135651.1 hypothetical protein N7512_000811 [Penicillium capsulatum]